MSLEYTNHTCIHVYIYKKKRKRFGNKSRQRILCTHIDRQQTIPILGDGGDGPGFGGFTPVFTG